MVRPFLGDRKGSMRDVIHRAIIDFPHQEFTSRQLYDFIVMSADKPRSANVPRNVPSLASILAQAAREGVVSKTFTSKRRMIWRRQEPMVCPDCGSTFNDEHECGEL